MYTYLKNNYIQGLRNSPARAWQVSVLVTVLYMAIAIGMGFATGLLTIDVLDSSLAWALPVILFIFPSLLEESVFRGLIIPNNSRDRGAGYIVMITLLSSVIFVLWHPLNALTINPGAREIFTDQYFLVITFFLGVACAISYIYSRSLWAPVIIHWITVVVWVLFLGGRNLVLQ